MVFWVCAALVLVLDQLSKWAVINYLSAVDGHVLSLGIFDIRLVYNKGAAFGILQGHQQLLIIVALCAVCGAVFYLHKYQHGFRMKLLAGLITGGALGNLVDRALLGYVVDFIDFRWWPVFNLADSAIVVGACLLAISIVTGCDKEGNAHE